MRTFSEINQFRHAVARVQHQAQYVGQDADGNPIYDTSLPLPKLTFRGLVKLHGTNAGMQLDQAGIFKTSSREREITGDDDNAGFAAQAHLRIAERNQLMQVLQDSTPADLAGDVVQWNLFGEWCGPTVNGKTAIGKLPNRWVCFNVLYTLTDGTEVWRPVDAVAEAWRAAVPQGADWLYFITDYQQWNLEIDFNNPEASLAILEELTLAVEANCPVAQAMGGEPGIGEGIVWSLYTERDRIWFKTKGAKHKGTKNAKLVQYTPEVMASREAFAEAVLTDSRLEQAFDLFKGARGTLDPDNMGKFLQWVGNDVLKEESDTMAASGLSRHDVMGLINNQAKRWVAPRLSKF